MLISGYFMVMSGRRSLWMIVELITQVISFQVMLFLLKVALGNEFSIMAFLGKFLLENYFVILYCVVFVVSPYVGFVMNKLNKKMLTFLMGLLGFCFSIWPTAVDFVETLLGHSLAGLTSLGMFEDGVGHTFIKFLLCWMIGAYILFII